MTDDVLHNILTKQLESKAGHQRFEFGIIDYFRKHDTQVRLKHNANKRERYRKERLEHKKRLKNSKAREFLKGVL